MRRDYPSFFFRYVWGFILCLATSTAASLPSAPSSSTPVSGPVHSSPAAQSHTVQASSDPCTSLSLCEHPNFEAQRLSAPSVTYCAGRDEGLTCTISKPKAPALIWDQSGVTLGESPPSGRRRYQSSSHHIARSAESRKGSRISQKVCRSHCQLAPREVESVGGIPPPFSQSTQ
ncbi:hypothetical protein JCGZ_05101 [Jatropha curcas]|uniref:Ig-like domain-containing protein n=1 Tax=Jatropha curcas TaxID=180498 RepID=A0A067LR40_JATCU|nr:hypothetical protein JCGZ_05101 [Jatropha curcas]